MFSTPPARTTSASPIAMRRAASTTDSIPDAQLRDTEWAGLSFGTPARSAMIRAMFAASTGVAMFPKIDWSTADGLDAGAGHRLDGRGAAEVDRRDAREVRAHARERACGRR